MRDGVAGLLILTNLLFVVVLMKKIVQKRKEYPTSGKRYTPHVGVRKEIERAYIVCDR